MTNGEAENAVNALLMLRSEMAQREALTSASFGQQIQSLQQQVGQFRQDVKGIVSDASVQIATEAKEAVVPTVREYDRAVSATSAHLQGANRTVWMWFGAAGTILMLVLFVGWSVLGYYRRELAAVQDELHRYESAVPVVQAFHASDATLCGDRLCVNVDPKAQRVGLEKQYRQARPRPQQ